MDLAKSGVAGVSHNKKEEHADWLFVDCVQKLLLGSTLFKTLISIICKKT